jgi:ATP-binding cassette subfamily F protein uup
VATSIIAWEGDESLGQWREYEGSVQDWITQRERAQRMREAKNSSKNSPSPAKNVREQLSNSERAPAAPPAPAKKARKLSFKEQRELDALPAQIAALEAEQTTINKRLQDGKLYADDPALATQLAQRSTALDDELLACLERQEALS